MCVVPACVLSREILREQNRFLIISQRWVVWVDGRDVEKYKRLTRSQRYMYGRGKIDLDGTPVQ